MQKTYSTFYLLEAQRAPLEPVFSPEGATKTCDNITFEAKTSHSHVVSTVITN